MISSADGIGKRPERPGFQKFLAKSGRHGKFD
jgi:hypothetical protein